MMGVPGGPPPPEAPCKHIVGNINPHSRPQDANIKYTLVYKNVIFKILIRMSWRKVFFLPHMHQERVMSKASEVKTDQQGL